MATIFVVFGGIHTHIFVLFYPQLPLSPIADFVSIVLSCRTPRTEGKWGGTYPSTAATPLTPPNRVHTHYIPFFDSCQLERMTSWTQNSNTTTLCLNFAASLELESIIRYLVLTFFFVVVVKLFPQKDIQQVRSF